MDGKTNGESVSIIIGRFYMIRKDNELRKGEVLQERLNTENDTMEYFVHYNALDKRLDEWVTRDCVEGEIAPENSSNDSRLEISDEDPERVRYLTRNKLRPESEDEETQNDEEKLEEEHERLTKVKYIKCVQFGKYEILTWYFSPYPDEYGKQAKLFICEYCLKYMKLEQTYRYHLADCQVRRPPGRNVYSKGTLEIYEINAVDNLIYCQNLCLFAKLFIDHKTIFFDLGQFMFYVLCEVDSEGSHIVGYFSKEKLSPEGYNLACIVTIPPFQKRGYGKLLIGFSYELSKLEGVVGTPEKPISDLGRLSFLSYWSWVVLDLLSEHRGIIPLSEISRATSISIEDLRATLKYLDCRRRTYDKHAILIPQELVDCKVTSGKFKRPRLTIDPACVLLRKPKSENENGFRSHSSESTSSRSETEESQSTSSSSDGNSSDFYGESETE